MSALNIRFDPNLQRKLSGHVRKEFIRPTIARMIHELQDIIPQFIVDKIIESEVWQGLLGAFSGDPILDLQAVLGIEDVSVLDALSHFLLNEIKVQRISIDGHVALQIGIISQTAFNQLLNADFGSYISDTSDEPINWLNWILTGLSDPIFATLIFRNSPTSRTGRAVMAIHTGSWDIQQHVNASIDDNFIVRTVNDNIDEILDIIRKSFIRNIQRVAKS